MFLLMLTGGNSCIAQGAKSKFKPKFMIIPIPISYPGIASGILNASRVPFLIQFGKYLAFCGKLAISGSFSVIYIYAAGICFSILIITSLLRQELYPTEVRSIGISLGQMVGCVGSM